MQGNSAASVSGEPAVSRGACDRGRSQGLDVPELILDAGGDAGVNDWGAEALPAISLVAPAFEEEANLETLHRRVAEVMDPWCRWELILVDDGSRDGTADCIRRLCRRDGRVRGHLLSENRGQTSATFVGVDGASSRWIATLDADLQNDPVDLRGMFEARGDADAVVGYRVRRNDVWSKRVSSRIANWVRNRISGDTIRDTGCALKLFRADAIRSLPRFEGMHRFLPTLLRYRGYSVLEHPVSHHPRKAGQSKYGVRNRAWRAFRDLIAVRWMRSRMIRLPGVESIGGEPVEATVESVESDRVDVQVPSATHPS